jgi:hypothetical protein
MGMSASQARLLSLTARMSDLEFQAQSISNSKIRLADESAEASKSYSTELDKQKYTVYNAGSDANIDATINNLTAYNQQLDTSSTQSKYRYIKDSADKLCISEKVLTDLGCTVVNGKMTSGPTVNLDTYLGNNGIKKDATTGQYDTTSAGYKYYNEIYTQVDAMNCTVISNDDADDSDYLSRQVQQGNFYLYEFNTSGQTKDAAGNITKGSFEGVSWDSGDSSISEADDKRQLAKAEAEYDYTMANIQSKDKRFDLQLKGIETEHSAIQTEIDSVKKVIDKNIEKSFKIFDA